MLTKFGEASDGTPGAGAEHKQGDPGFPLGMGSGGDGYTDLMFRRHMRAREWQIVVRMSTSYV